jgi:hypothetical protein
MQQHVRAERPALPPECHALEPLLDGLMARELPDRFTDAATAQQALAAAAAGLSTSPTMLVPLPAPAAAVMPQELTGPDMNEAVA